MSDTYNPAGPPPAPPPQPDLTQPSGWDGPPPSQDEEGPGPGQPPVADPYPTQADAVAAQANPGPIPPPDAPPAPTPAERHPLGVGDVHDRLVALELWMQELYAKVKAGL